MAIIFEQTYCVWFKTPMGKVHHGSPLSLANAQAWVERMNREHPEIHHWVAPPPERQDTGAN